ncbi:MAG: hypothetical protein KGS61_11530 [Verrucomicrobia bacterium]|nr:hypothetical protein [Verrucomicrobiota bacterium]
MNCLAPVAADVCRLHFSGGQMERTDIRCCSMHGKPHFASDIRGGYFYFA